MRRHIPFGLTCVIALSLLLPSTALALRVVTYNVLNFPGSTGTSRLDDFRVILEDLDPSYNFV